MLKISIYLIFSLLLFNCSSTEAQKNQLIQDSGNTIRTRFALPPHFQRIVSPANSFANYLQNLSLKPKNTKALTFSGAIKQPENVYEAVVDMEIGTKDLQQCADAIIRLRAEYLFQQKKNQAIQFHFTNGDLCAWEKYAEGYRAKINGNKVQWIKSAKLDVSYANFRHYLDLVFTYAGTRSLNQELTQVADIQSIMISDVWIEAGSPGHAVIVVDMAINPQTQEKIFLLAQSYMPAQDIQILKNFNQSNISPWYSANSIQELITPEWTFQKKHLKRFGK